MLQLCPVGPRGHNTAASEVATRLCRNPVACRSVDSRYEKLEAASSTRNCGVRTTSTQVIKKKKKIISRDLRTETQKKKKQGSASSKQPPSPASATNAPLSLSSHRQRLGRSWRRAPPAHRLSCNGAIARQPPATPQIIANAPGPLARQLRQSTPLSPSPRWIRPPFVRGLAVGVEPSSLDRRRRHVRHEKRPRQRDQKPP
jgi:hypothetical protein